MFDAAEDERPPGHKPEPGTSDVTAKLKARQLEREIKQMATRLGGSHFEVLGVTREATSVTVRHKYTVLSKKLHPRFLPPEISDEALSNAKRAFQRVNDKSGYRVSHAFVQPGFELLVEFIDGHLARYASLTIGG